MSRCWVFTCAVLLTVRECQHWLKEKRKAVKTGSGIEARGAIAAELGIMEAIVGSVGG